MIRIACATNDGVSFYRGHFGDAPFFVVFDMDERGGYSRVGTIENTIPEERMHGDPEKAKGIMYIMKENNVQVLVNAQFGPNIKRIRMNFVAVLSNIHNINDALAALKKLYPEIEENLKKEGQKDILIIP